MELRAIYGQAFTFMAPLISTVAAPSFLRAGGFSTGDFAINHGGAASFSNVANLPTHIADGVYVFSLTNTETQANKIMYKAVRASNAPFYDQGFLIETYSDSQYVIPTGAVIRALADSAVGAVIPTNFSSMKIEADGHVHGDIKEWLGTAPLALVSQRPQVDVRAMINSVENQIADHVIRRQWGNVTDGDAEDDRSLLGIIAQGVNFVYSSGGNLVVYRDDDVTTFAIKALTTSGVDDVVGITPPA